MFLEILKKMVEEGLVGVQKHPEKSLLIYNYTPRVQFEKIWNEVTMQTRGLIVDSKNGKIVGRPFRKFFNLEEHDEKDLPKENFDVYEKLDGSLGIGIYYEGEFLISTRGSFTSDQAIKAKEIAKKYRMSLIGDRDFYQATSYTIFGEDATLLFEIIYPENRIVVDYGNTEELVLLGVIETSTGRELPYINLIRVSEVLGCPVVKKYDGIKDISSIKEMIGDDEEGYVIRFNSGFRMKVKGSEYVRLHRILTNISNRDIWQYLKDKKPLEEILNKVPDEFYGWVKKTIKDFEYKYEEILNEVYRDFEEIDGIISREEESKFLVYDEKEYKKKYAELAKTKKYPDLLFSYRSEPMELKKTSEKIWKFLYPDYSKPFKKEN